VLPAVGSLAAAALRSPAIAGALATAAVLTKPQAIVIAPALALAIVKCGERGEARRPLAPASSAAAVRGAIVLAPVGAAGAMPNLINALSRLGYHDMLSGNASNLWWIVGYLLRVYYSAHDLGTWAAITAPARILAISRVVELGYPNPRTVGIVLTLGVAA